MSCNTTHHFLTTTVNQNGVVVAGSATIFLIKNCQKEVNRWQNSPQKMILMAQELKKLISHIMSAVFVVICILGGRQRKIQKYDGKGCGGA